MQDLPGAAFPDHFLRPSTLDKSMMAIQELHIEAGCFWDNISIPQFEVQLKTLCKSAIMHSTAGIIVGRALQLQSIEV
jgi:hypothetical protein